VKSPLLIISRFFFLTILIFVYSNIFCQLNINTAPTPAQMVQNILVGGGITVSNISYTGGATSRASFTNGGTTNLGLNDGIILSTSLVTQIANPATYFMSNDLALAGDADLDAINNGCLTYDACVLEFDFVPLSDTVKFRYVFGSEEYPRYVCAIYNDIFAFFISGPNPTGPAYNNYNIALIPGTTLPVSVNSVNTGIIGSNANGGDCTLPGQSLAYSSLYVDNAGIGGTTIAFGGFTVPLTAWCHVTPCQTYHIKLAVADGFNGNFDSGVFLEANSFTSNTFSVSTSYSNAAFGNYAMEGCSQGIFSFLLSSPATTPYIINYTISGTASSGADYTAIPNSITIPVGQDSAGVVIDPVLDGIPEVAETVIINYTSGCTPQTDTIFISDNAVLQVTASNDTTICSGSAVTIVVNASGGIAPYVYTWSSGIFGNTINVTPNVTTTYTVTVTDNCSQSATAEITVTVNSVSVAVSSVDENCNLSNGSVTATATGSCSTGYSYLWSCFPPQTTATVINLPASTYTVTVSCGTCTASASVTINSIPGPTISINVITDANCQQSDGSVTTIVTGGTAPLSYSWNSTPVQTTSDLLNVPTGNYTVTVTDAMGCSSTASVLIGQINGPQVSATMVNNATCSASDGTATSTVSGGTAPYSYSWNSTPPQTTPDLLNVPSGNYTVSVTDASGCIGFASVIIGQVNGLSVTASAVDASCGASDGSATTTPSGGTSPYSYLWNSTPAQTTPDLQNAPTGNYEVTVTDGNGCTASTTVVIGELSGPVVTASSQDEVCRQGNGTATALASGGDGTYTYLWSSNPPQTTAVATGLSAGNYTVTVYSGMCSDTVTVSVNNIPGPSADISLNPPVTSILNGLVNFSGSSTGNILTWQWFFGDGSGGSGQSLQHQYDDIDTYWVMLVVTDNNGCTDTVTDSVVVQDIFTLYIPNSFTPDNDGKNDYFLPQGVNVDPDDYKMEIYDRWGNLIFVTKIWGEGWNGTKDNLGSWSDVMQGVYVYKITAHETHKRLHDYIGRVVIIK
jgi:gliding motility-associated-like protein